MCVCARVLLGVCSSNKGKRCVPHYLSRWLCSALSACLISVSVSVSPVVELDGSQPVDLLEQNWKDIWVIFFYALFLLVYFCWTCMFDFLGARRKDVCVFVCPAVKCVCLCVDRRGKLCMVLPTPLEMLGCPAWLFLDQWQRVNGCRCVAKEGSEIPTDPGRSLPSATCCLLVCPFFPLVKCPFSHFSLISPWTHGPFRFLQLSFTVPNLLSLIHSLLFFLHQL